MRIVGIGGSTRDGSSTEVLVRAVLNATAERGAETALLAGQALVLPPYEPGRALPRKARLLIDAVREADGLVFGSPGYHGTMSGLVKNALDYLEELAGDDRPYVEGLPVACVVTASGWQAAVNTLRALRETVHALRGWPTPLGLAVNVAEGLLDDEGRFRDSRLPEQIGAVATQLVTFAQAAGPDRSAIGTSATGAVELVVEQVRRAIGLGRYGAGDRLPSPLEIAEQLGVAPETARSALGGLAADGILEWPSPRHGRPAVAGGGLVEPRTSAEERVAEFEEIIDFRIANECAAARLAAARRSAEDLAALRDALERMHQAARASATPAAVGRFHRADTDFHLGVARAARNRLLERAVADARTRQFLPVGAVFSHLSERADDLHQAIADAIELGDGDAAAGAMAAHIEATRADIGAVLGSPSRAVLA